MEGQQAPTYLLKVRVSTKAVKGEVVGWMGDGALKIRAVAAPEGGRVNLEVLRLVAQELDIPVRDVALHSGSTSTTKTLKISGIDPEEVRRRLSKCPTLSGE